MHTKGLRYDLTAVAAGLIIVPDKYTNNNMQSETNKNILKRFLLVTLFAIAFAYIEATVVVYLREIFYPDGFNFPIVDFRTITGFGRFLFIEVGREAATFILMFTSSWLMAKDLRRRLAHFLIIFAVWDIFYYVWLKVLLDWPASIMDWDIVFLIPLTWASPILAPVTTSLTMLLIAIALLGEKPITITRLRATAFISAVVLVIVCFCVAGLGITQADYKSWFSWPIFGTLHLIIITLFFRCMTKSREY